MRPKRPNLREVWDGVKDHVGRTRPYGIDKQTEINTWCATYRDTFMRIVPELLNQRVDSIPQIRDIVEQTQDRLTAELMAEWGTGR